MKKRTSHVPLHGSDRGWQVSPQYQYSSVSYCRHSPRQFSLWLMLGQIPLQGASMGTHSPLQTYGELKFESQKPKQLTVQDDRGHFPWQGIFRSWHWSSHFHCSPSYSLFRMQRPSQFRNLPTNKENVRNHRPCQGSQTCGPKKCVSMAPESLLSRQN